MSEAQRTEQMERPPEPAEFDVVLAYEAPKAAVAEDLANRLEQAGLHPDRPGPGESISPERLSNASGCALLIGVAGYDELALKAADEQRGPLLIGSPSYDELALKAADEERGRVPSFRVVGVLLPGAPVSLAFDASLPMTNWVDMTVGHADPIAFQNLVAVIRGRDEPWDVGPIGGKVAFERTEFPQPITAFALARRLLGSDGNDFDLGPQPRGSLKPRGFDTWLLEVRRLFDRSRLERLGDFHVLAGLALLDPKLRERLDRHGLLDGVLAQVGDLEPLLTAFARAIRAEQARADSHRPEARISRDFWTAEDFLGYDFYADAIKEFIAHKDTQPPLVIGIKAPWGAGKTSLMRMVRRGLDSGADADPPEERGHRARLTNAELLRLTRQGAADAALELFPPQSIVDRASRTTVWFNAWKYQSSEQTWSGLAHAIIAEVESRMTRIQRERFWASLNLARVNPAEVRRRIYRVLLERVVPFGVALLVVGAAALGAYLLAPVFPSISNWLKGISGGSIVLTAVGGTAGAFKRTRTFLEEEVARSDPGLVSDPGYEGRLGFLHLVQTDMARVLDLVASEQRPLVVFVDDLDRCSYSTVAQTIEALNLFLAGDFCNCIFVIAMEPDLVAAHIEVAYKDVFAALADDELGGDPTTLGWRFLEKMVQLPLSLPVPHTDQLAAYVESILGKKQERPAVDRARVDEHRERIRERQPSLDAIERSSVRELRRLADASDGSDPHDPALIRALEEEFSEALTDADPAVQAVIRRHASDLARNPREIKRFINVFRFYALIQFRRKLRGLPAPTYEQVGKLAVLAVRWPHLLSVLGRPSGVQKGNVLSQLESLAVESKADDDPAAVWRAGLAKASFTKRLQEELGSDELRTILARKPKIGTAAEGFL